MRRICKRVGCCLFALWLAALAPLAVSAQSLEEIQAQQEQLQAENQQLQTQLDSLREDQAQKQAYLETLQEQISLVQEQILTTRENIQDLNESIGQLTLKLEASQAEVQDTIDLFKQRLVALYTAGNVSTLEILLDSKSLSDFTTRMELIDTMALRDQEIIGQLEDYMAKTQADREQLEAQKQEVASLQVTLEGKEKELAALYEENQAALGDIQGQVYATENQLQVNEEELAESERLVQEAIAAQKRAEEEAKKQAQAAAPPAAVETPSGGENSGGENGSGNGDGGSGAVSPPTPSGGGSSGFDPIWPLPGVTYISDHFGGARGHKGMDIAGPWGTPIVAAADGQVIEANSTDSWGYSWGYYVLIYHNGTYSTRYAHMSSVAVSTGQYVTAGTIIGYEGNTGNSFGAHLHFEVYENGTRVNPARFLL